MCAKRVLLRIIGVSCLLGLAGLAGYADSYNRTFDGRELIWRYEFNGFVEHVQFYPPNDHCWVGKQDDVDPSRTNESFRARFRWNVAVIPDGSTINSATITITSIATSNRTNANSVLFYVRSSANPQWGQFNLAAWDNIAVGLEYANRILPTATYQELSIPFTAGSDFCTAIRNSLASDYFQIALNAQWDENFGTNEGSVHSIDLRRIDGNTDATVRLAIDYTPPANPVPAISSISPSNAMAGGSAFTLDVFGSNFRSSSIVRWNTSDRATTFVGIGHLRASIPASDIANPGAASVTVYSPPPGGGTSNPFTFTVMPTVANVTVHQSLSDAITEVGTLGRWNGSSFGPRLPAPQTYEFQIPSLQVLHGDTLIHQNEKYGRWIRGAVQEPSVLNHHRFDVNNGFPSSLTSQFVPAAPAIVIKADLLDLPGTSAGSIKFRDPWYIDYADEDYGNSPRNRGQADAVFHVREVGTTGFRPDYATEYDGGRKYRGVFLNQNPQWDVTKPNYSVGAPETQSIGGWESHFVGWHGHPDSAAFQYPESTTTGVVFNQPNATVTARYKAHLGSSTPAATAANNQRKIVTVEGVSHAVYESAGDVYYTRSLNGGSTWSAEKMISDGSGMNRQPSLAVLPSIVIQGGVFIGVVWEKYEDAFGLSNLRFRRLDILQDLWLPTVDIESIPLNDRPLVGFEGATPVVSGVPGLWCIVWKRPNSEWTGSPGLCLWVYDEQGVQGAHYGVLEGTSDASMQPALHYLQENTSWFRLAWSQEGDILYSEFSPDNGALSWGTPTDLTAGYSWMISATRPSIVSRAWNSAFVVWEASKDQVIEDESPLSGAVGRRQVFLREKTNVWQPVTELSYYWGTDEITPVVGLDNSKVTVLWNWGVTGLARASRDLTGSGWSIAHVGYGYWPALPGYTQTGTPLRMSTGVPGPPHAVQFEQDPPSSPLADSKAGDEPGVSGAGRGVLVSRTATLVLDSLTIPTIGRGAVSGRVIVTASLPEVRTESGRLPVSFRRDTLKFERWLETEGTAIPPNATEARLPVAVSLRGVRINNPGVPTSLPVLQAGMKAGSKSTLLARVTIGDLLASAGRDTTIRIVSVAALDRHRNATLEFTQRLSGVEEGLVAWTEMVSADTSLDAGPTATASAAKQPAAAASLPETFLIRDAFPNPFNPSSEIRYELPEPARVSLTVYDVLGRVVEALLDETKEAGYHAVKWDAAGRSSGVYLARFTATAATGTVALQRTMKLVLAK